MFPMDLRDEKKTFDISLSDSSVAGACLSPPQPSGPTDHDQRCSREVETGRVKPGAMSDA